jgi:hypothetical protein
MTRRSFAHVSSLSIASSTRRRAVARPRPTFMFLRNRSIRRHKARDQAGITFALAAKMVRLNPDLRRTVTIQETAKSLICPELGTRYRALSPPTPPPPMGSPRWLFTTSLVKFAVRVRRCTKRWRSPPAHRRSRFPSSSPRKLRPTLTCFRFSSTMLLLVMIRTPSSSSTVLPRSWTL